MPICGRDPYSQNQWTKAQRCTVWRDGEGGYGVYDPKVNREHRVIENKCDCVGFELRSYCSHILAIEVAKENEKPATEAIRELFDF